MRSWKPSASEKLQGQTIFSSDLSEISDNTCGKISPQTLEKRYRSLVKPYMLQGKSVSNKFSNDSIVSVHGISSDQCCRTLDVTLLVEMQYIEHLIKIAKSSIQYPVSSILHEVYSREWFRSTDLWVVGPARFHCATLLMLSTRLRLLDDMLKCQRNMTGHSDSAFEIKSLLFLTRS